MRRYDYLIVGAGLFGSVFAHEAAVRGKKCLVIEKRDHTGGNVYCRNIEGINVHVYGAHIFHTSVRRVWDYVNRFVEFNNYINSPIANYKGEIYNLPFNMNTFNRMWGVVTPEQARRKIDEQIARSGITSPRNLEEQAISMVGKDIYQKLIKGYTEKQWGRDCADLPASIIKRVPLRFIYDNNYFNDRYQGIPIGGYNRLTEQLLEGVTVETGCDFIKNRKEYESLADKIVYTGAIDAYYKYCYGPLEYRSLRFETQLMDTDDFQGNAVVNYTERDIPYTRIIEHKHFEFGTQSKTVITKEYPAEWVEGMEPYYPINDQKNQELYRRYATLAEKEDKVMFGGRLAEYKYYDMDKIILSALQLADKVFG